MTTITELHNARERTLATYEQVVEPEMDSPKSNGAGRHISEIFNKNITNQ